MSGLLIEAHDWPEDVRPFVRDVEMRLMQRRVKYYPSTLSTLAASAERTTSVCTDAGAAGAYQCDKPTTRI